ncbi:MAG: hypothetical protein ACRDBL_00635 [Rhabdaerophilum sp.]
MAMIEAGEVSGRTLVRTLGGPEHWQRTDATALMGLARLEPRTANKLACFLAGVVFAGLAALAPINPASAQSERRSGTTSPSYCGTAMVEELARRIGGRVGGFAGDGSTDFKAPEIGAEDFISVRCGHDPETVGTYHGRHDWAPAFVNAFLAISEQTMGRPQLELVQAMAQCRRLASRPFNRVTGFGFSKEDNSATAEVHTRRFRLFCNFENDPVYSVYRFKPPSPRN